MRLELTSLMNEILTHPDAAIDAGWTMRHWESIGFANFARRRIQDMFDLHTVLASLGSVELLSKLSSYQSTEPVILVDSPFLQVMRPRCDTCGGEVIDKCMQCGAPVCCPSCCSDTAQQYYKHVL